MTIRQFSLASALLVPVLIAPSVANAYDTYDACKSASAKLAVQYEMHTLSEFPSQDKQLRSAEFLAGVFYGMSKKDLDAAWPGLYSWAVKTSLVGFRARMRDQRFRTFAFEECLGRFDD